MEKKNRCSNFYTWLPIFLFFLFYKSVPLLERTYETEVRKKTQNSAYGEQFVLWSHPEKCPIDWAWSLDLPNMFTLNRTAGKAWWISMWVQKACGCTTPLGWRTRRQTLQDLCRVNPSVRTQLLFLLFACSFQVVVLWQIIRTHSLHFDLFSPLGVLYIYNLRY